MNPLSVALFTLASVVLRSESRYIASDPTTGIFNDSFIFPVSSLQRTESHIKHAPLDLLKTILGKINEAMVREQMEYIQVPPVSFSILVASVSTEKGRVGKFSTLVLQGDNQILRKMNVKGGVIYSFDLRLGMQNLNLQYPYNYQIALLFRNSGVLRVDSNDDTVRARGVVNVKNDGRCTAILKNVEMTDMGEYNVNITPQDIPGWIFKGIMNFVTNKVLPFFIPTINLKIKEIVTPPERVADFSKLICDHVVHDIVQLF